MTLALTPQEWVDRLAGMADDQSEDLRKFNSYYDLSQPLSYMHPDLWLAVASRIRPVLVAWPQVVVDSVEERLCVEGFRWNRQSVDDEEIYDWWQANCLDESSGQTHLEALVSGRGFVIVGADPDDPTLPKITVESSLEVTADFDPQTRECRAAMKAWTDDKQQFITLYLPDVTYYFHRTGIGSVEAVAEPDVHLLGVVPVVPFVNRSRILRLGWNQQPAPPGLSEIAPIIPLSDAACKIATDMMVAAETVAIPSRYIFGIEQDEFIDKDGNDISPWKTVLGKMMTHEDKDLVAGQWTQATLDNFHGTLNELARMVAAVAALPPHYLGFTTDNPASADAIRSNEARLVKRAERKQVSFGESWESVMNMAYRIVHGEWNPDARRLETRWRDASTPTVGQKADAVVKLVATGIIPFQQAREDLGYTAAQVSNMESWDDENDAEEAAELAALPAPVTKITQPLPTEE